MDNNTASQSPQFVSDARFFAQNGIASSSLPNPTETQPQVPASDPEQIDQPSAADTQVQPLQEQPEVTEPGTTESDILAESLFETELPTESSSVHTESTPEPTVPAEFTEFKPDTSAPTWQHESFQNIVSDETLSPQDKRDILTRDPFSWSKQKKWHRDSKVLGKFRDSGVPITDVLAELSAQNSSRAESLEIASVAAVLSDESKILSFAESNPELYSQLMVALVDTVPDHVETILARKGFVVTKAAPISAESILSELESNPYYEAIRGTDLETEIINKLSELTARAGGDNSIEEKSPDQSDAAEAQKLERFEAANNAYRTVQTDVFYKSVSEGLQSQGIKPATQSEVQANPLAALKTIIYTIGVHRLNGVNIPPPDVQIDQIAGEDAEYNETIGEMEAMLRTSRFQDFQSKARALSPHYFKLGTLRAGIPMLRSLYAAVQRACGEQPTQKVPEVQPSVPQTVGAPSTLQRRDTGFSSDKLFFEKNGM